MQGRRLAFIGYLPCKAGDWGSADYAYTPIHKLAREQTLGIENLSDENVPANLLVNGSHKKTLSLEKYAKDAENRALSCAAEIMTLSFEDDDIYPYTSYAGEEYKEYVYMDEYRYHTVSYRPEQPFIAHSVAYILASNTADKSFGGVVFASAYGFCFPHIKSRLKKADKFLREWKCIPFGVSCLYEISDNDKLEPFAFRTFGGVDCEVTVLGDTLWLCDTVFGEYAGGVATLLSSRHLELKSSSPPQEWEKLIPVGTGFYRMNKFGLLTFYNSKEVLVAENIPVYEDFLYIEMDSSFFQEERIIYFLNDKPNMQCKEYTPDGTVETLLLGEIGDYTVQVIKDDEGHVIGYENERYEVAAEKPILDGYYRKIDETTSKPLNFTPLFYEFKDGSYLCGINNGQNLATVGHVTTLAQRVKTELDTPDARKYGDVAIADGQIKFYAKVGDANPLKTIDLPEELFLDQVRTTFVPTFVFSNARIQVSALRAILSASNFHKTRAIFCLSPMTA